MSGKAMTVGELQRTLAEYDADTPVIVRMSDGYRKPYPELQQFDADLADGELTATVEAVVL